MSEREERLTETERKIDKSKRLEYLCGVLAIADVLVSVLGLLLVCGSLP